MTRLLFEREGPGRDTQGDWACPGAAMLISSQVQTLETQSHKDRRDRQSFIPAISLLWSQLLPVKWYLGLWIYCVIVRLTFYLLSNKHHRLLTD